MAAPYVEEAFWQDAAVDKRRVDGLGAALELRARNGQPMANFQLKNAELAGIDLVNHGGHAGFSLRDADLYRANLQNAHLFALDLRGSSLMKADLRRANLHCADLRDCNLLGILLDGARLDNIIWDRQLLQERKGREQLRGGDTAAAIQLFQEAEETYRNLRLHLEQAGLFEQGDCSSIARWSCAACRCRATRAGACCPGWSTCSAATAKSRSTWCCFPSV